MAEPSGTAAKPAAGGGLPRRVQEEPAPSTTASWLPLLTILGTVLTVLGSSTWALYTYGQNLRFEAQKPFLLKKLEIVTDAVKTAGQLTWLTPNSEDWNKAASRIKALRWSEMQMVGSPVTRVSIREMLADMETFERAPTVDNGYRLKRRIECLADELRNSLEDDWKAVSIIAGGGTKIKIDADWETQRSRECLQNIPSAPPSPAP